MDSDQNSCFPCGDLLGTVGTGASRTEDCMGMYDVINAYDCLQKSAILEIILLVGLSHMLDVLQGDIKRIMSSVVVLNVHLEPQQHIQELLIQITVLIKYINLQLCIYIHIHTHICTRMYQKTHQN